VKAKNRKRTQPSKPPAVALPQRGRVVLTPSVVADVAKRRARGHSFEDIARALGISKGSVVRAEKMAAELPPPSRARAARPAVPPASAPVAAEEMSPEEFGTWLATQLRLAQVDADACRAKDDQVGASKAMRLAAQLAALLSKAHARAKEDGDTVRVKISDVAAAGERARAKLHDLAARLAAAKGAPS